MGGVGFCCAGFSYAKDTSIGARSNVRTTAIEKFFLARVFKRKRTHCARQILTDPLGQATLSYVSFCIESILFTFSAQPLRKTRNNHVYCFHCGQFTISTPGD